MLKRIGWIVLAGGLMSLPASFYMSRKLSAPLWYLVLQNVFQAIGIGLFAMAIGIMVILARRNTQSGGIKIALVLMALVSAFIFYTVITTESRLR